MRVTAVDKRNENSQQLQSVTVSQVPELHKAFCCAMWQRKEIITSLLAGGVGGILAINLTSSPGLFLSLFIFHMPSFVIV